MPRRRFFLFRALLGCLALLPVGCSAGGSDSTATTTDPAGSDPGDPPLRGGDTINVDGSTNQDGTNDVSVDHGALSIGPSGITSLTIVASDTPATQQFDLIFADGTRPAAANWTVDDGALGSISPTGLFQTHGLIGGTVTVTARVGSLVVSVALQIVVRVTRDNPGGISLDQQTKLQAGGNADPTFAWLYPYDKTVFPLDLPPPVLQFGGQNATAFYLKITSDGFTYDGFLPATNQRLALPASVWKGLTYSNAGGNSVRVEVTQWADGQVTGPRAESWTVAKGKLKGFIYYNTYRSPKADRQGAVMRIRGEATEPEVVRPGCTVCHSVSANGNRLISGIDWGNGNPRVSGSFKISPDMSTPIPVPDQQDTDGRKFAFGALTPDGTWFVNQGGPSGNWPIRGLANSLPSKLYETDTGNEVALPGGDLASLGISYVITPAFSPGGTLFAFSRYDQDAGRSLALLDFSSAGPGFSGLRKIAETDNPAEKHVVGWPSFLPDDKALVYQDGTKYDTENQSFAQIYLVDVTTKKVSKLDRLNGLADGARYLPWSTESNEDKKNYEPSVVPAAVGGYYWVIFTSRRAYGNLICPGVMIKESGSNGETYDAGDSFGHALGHKAGEEPIGSSPRKKLWVAAIDLDYSSGADPSHPAFYLPGQEFESGNMRAFAALEPCRADGSSCESGLDCCGGFCRQSGNDSDGAPVLTCLPQAPSSCSQEDEKCANAADCCGAPQGYQCINQHCARPRSSSVIR